MTEIEILEAAIEILKKHKNLLEKKESPRVGVRVPSRIKDKSFSYKENNKQEEEIDSSKYRNRDTESIDRDTTYYKKKEEGLLREKQPSDSKINFKRNFVIDWYKYHRLKNKEVLSKNYQELPVDEIIDKSCIELEKLCRIDNFVFAEEVKPALIHAATDEFWNTNLINLTQVRKKCRNGLTKFENIRTNYMKKKPKESGESPEKIIENAKIVYLNDEDRNIDASLRHEIASFCHDICFRVSRVAGREVSPVERKFGARLAVDIYNHCVSAQKEEKLQYISYGEIMTKFLDFIEERYGSWSELQLKHLSVGGSLWNNFTSSIRKDEDEVKFY